MLGKIYKIVCKLEVTLAMYLLLASVAVIFTAAVLRTVGHPIRWGTDFALLLFTWGTLMSSDVVFHHRRHVVVDILVSRLPKPLASIVNLFAHIIILISLVFLIYYGAKISYLSRARVFQGIPWLSYSFVAVSVPVCMSLMLISELRQLYYQYILHQEYEEEF